MSNKGEITDAYEPDEELQELLEDMSNNISAMISPQKQMSLISDPPGLELQNISWEYKNKTIMMNGITLPLGFFITLQGDPGMTSAFILNLSREFGKPTLTYETSIDHHGDRPDFNEVTAEWHGEEFIERGVHELGLKNSAEISETHNVPIETLEQRAKHWLSSK